MPHHRTILELAIALPLVASSLWLCQSQRDLKDRLAAIETTGGEEEAAPEGWPPSAEVAPHRDGTIAGPALAPGPSPGAGAGKFAVLESRVLSLEKRVLELQQQRADGDAVVENLEGNPEVREKIADIVHETEREVRQQRMQHMREAMRNEVDRFVAERKLDEDLATEVVAIVDGMFEARGELFRKVEARELSFSEVRDRFETISKEAESKLKELLGKEDYDAMREQVPMIGHRPGRGGFMGR